MGQLRPVRLLYLTALVVFVLDRASKWLASSTLAGRPPVRVIPDVLQFTYTTNTGGAFGIFDHIPWLFAVATVVIAAFIVRASTRVTRPLVAVSLGLVLGGALGNLADRLSGGFDLSGRVVDFIDFRVWPVFNVADSAIVVGAILLVVATVKADRGGKRDRAKETEGSESA